MRLVTLLVLLLSALMNSSPAFPQAGDPPVDLTLIVLQQGRPVPGVELTVDGHAYGTTGGGGALFTKFDAGERNVALRRGDDTVLEIELETIADETLQIIAVLDPNGGEPRIDIESSNRANQGRRGAASDTSIATGPPGRLRGRVVSTETGEPVANARVFVSGTAGDIRDRNGRHLRSRTPTGKLRGVGHPRRPQHANA